MYKLVNRVLRDGTTRVAAINIVGTETYIPLDENNGDYKRYLAWVAEGNTPLPADVLGE